MEKIILKGKCHVLKNLYLAQYDILDICLVPDEHLKNYLIGPSDWDLLNSYDSFQEAIIEYKKYINRDLSICIDKGDQKILYSDNDEYYIYIDMVETPVGFD